MTDVNDLRDIRSRVHVGRQGVSYTSTILSTDTFTEEELNQPFTLEKFKKDFKIVIQEIKEGMFLAIVCVCIFVRHILTMICVLSLLLYFLQQIPSYLI